MNPAALDPEVVRHAYNRIKPSINLTPLLQSSHLNNWLGHEVIFKVEALQKIGAFKTRGAINTMLSLKEQGKMPDVLATFSSGNHAQAVALAASLFGIRSTVFMAKTASKIKVQATRGYGAELIITENRAEAEARAKDLEKDRGTYFIHPFDNDMVIAGQGTACFEALETGIKPAAIFATCGGGGLLSGTYLAKELCSAESLVFAGEPANANDAARSYNSGQIVSFENSPKSIADGALTLAVSPRTFHYLQKLDGFYEIGEIEIIYWTQWLTHLLKISIEPTAAVAMAAAFKWLQMQKQKQQILVILSGGNIAPETQRIIWENDCLGKIPALS